MRLASADRRSFTKWLWCALGVLAWVILASAFSASQAAANETPDAATTTSEHGAANEAKGSPTANPNAANKPQDNTKPQADTKPQAPQAEKARPAAQADTGKSTAAKSTAAPPEKISKPEKVSKPPQTPPATVVHPTPNANANANSDKVPGQSAATSSRSAKHPSAPETSNGTANQGAANQGAAKSGNAWAGVPNASNPASHTPGDNAADPDSNGVERPSRDDNPGKANGKANGNAHAHAEGKAHAHAEGKAHAHACGHPNGHDACSAPASPSRHSSMQTAPAIPWRLLAPTSPVAQAVMTSMAAADDASPQGATSPDAPHADDPAITELWAAPVTTGAGAAGAAPMQVAGDAANGDPQHISVLLGIRTPVDDRAPSGPTSSTDCSPD